MESALHEAACGSAVDVVGLLLEHEEDVNQIDEYGSTPLHMSAFWGRGSNGAAIVRARG